MIDGIAAAMRRARQDYAAVFSGEAVLSMVDSLAEGADRQAVEAFTRQASAAAGVSFVVDVVLPFDRQEFEKDFADDASRAAFRAMLGTARAVLELPGDRAAEAAAYEAAAYTVVDQSDVLIAVWDGGPSGGRGGTTDTMEGAAREGKPLIVIDANGVAPPHLRWHGLDETIVPTGRMADMPADDATSALPVLVDTLLRPPPPAAAGTARHRHHDDEAAGLARYFEERAPKRTLIVGFPLMMALFRVQPLSGRHIRPPQPAELAEREIELLHVAPDAPAAARPRLIAGAFGWADFVGSLLAQIFRGAFILNFVFGALAVACAAISIVRHDWKPVLVVIEIVLIVAVVINTGLGRRRQWHRRWFEGRELAERLRVALLLWVVGLRPVTAPGAEPTWTGWYARAVVRARGAAPRRGLPATDSPPPAPR